MDLNMAAVRAGINPLMFSQLNLPGEQKIKEEKHDEEAVEEQVIIERKKAVKRRRSSRIKCKRARAFAKTQAFQDVTEYFRGLDKILRDRIAGITSVTQQSQIDKYTEKSESFIVTSYLTTARIFKYQKKDNCYTEVKRIPNRYVSLSSRIITSLHISKSKLYLAYLWGSSENSDLAKKSYLEVRDLDGSPISKPFFYDEAILSIDSDQDFVYVKTNDNTAYIHQQNFFNLFYHRIDFSDMTQTPLINTRVEFADYDSKTELLLMTASEKELILSEFDVHRHKEIHRIDLGSIQSILPYKDKYIVLRQRRVVDIVQILENSSRYEIKITSSLPFDNPILDLQVSDLNLFLLGPRELTCFSLDDLKIVWKKEMDVAENSRILVHEDHVVILEGQKMKIVTLPN